MANPERSAKQTPIFRREDRDEFRTTLAMLMARIISFLVFLLPFPLRKITADFAGSLAFRLSHGYRDNVLSNVSVVSGKAKDDPETIELAKSIFRANAQNFADLLIFPWHTGKWLLKRATLVHGDWSEIDAIRAESRGVIFVSAHIGCFDFIGQSFQARGYPLTVVTGRTTSRFVFDGVTWLRGRRGSTMVEPTPSGIRQVIKALRKNECAVLVADRDFFENGHEIDFFGQPTTLPPGAVRIARDTGAPIIPVFARRKGDGHEVGIFPAIRIEKTRDVKVDVAMGMQQLVPVLEQGIDACLEQWVMFQRVWPDTEPNPIRVFPIGSPLESPLLEKVARAFPERYPPADDVLSPGEHTGNPGDGAD